MDVVKSGESPVSNLAPSNVNERPLCNQPVSSHTWKPGVWLSSLLVLAACLGCGGSVEGPFAISGTVLLGGQPLEQGSISFASMTKGSRDATGGAISNGEYSISAEHGLKPGAYRVSISAADTSHATPGGLPANGLAFPSLIAPEFNKANHQIEVTSEGPNDFPFDVPKNKN